MAAADQALTDSFGQEGQEQWVTGTQRRTGLRVGERGLSTLSIPLTAHGSQ